MENLDKLTEKLIQWLEATEVFAQEQVPLVLQEILTWEFAAAITSMSLIFVAISAYLIFIATAKKPLVEEDCTPKGVVTLVGVVFSAVLVVVFIANIYNALQIHFAPRVYLIEYMRGLVD